MPELLALLDSGTTRTRLRVWDGERVVFSAERPVGARDVARAGSPEPLRATVRDLLAEARERWPVEALVCSGMITSESGLLEVPHVPAPADEARLARGVLRTDLPGSDLPCYFVPGVRTLAEAADWTSLSGADVMRGEEVQVLGLRARLELDGPALFLSLGSHHKLIWTDGASGILRSATALSGELLAAVAEHTVLRASVGPMTGWPAPDPELWRAGLDAARAHGVGRALFLIRLGGLTLGAGPTELSAYLQGVTASLTLDLLPEPDGQPLRLFGTPTLAECLAAELRRLGWPNVQAIDAATADEATALGAARVLARHLEGLEPG